MKRIYLFILLIVSFIVEITVTTIFINQMSNYQNDTVKINELIYGVKDNFNNEELYPKYYTYSILDNEDNLIYKTSDNTSISLNEAYRNKDTIVTINVNGIDYKICINNKINEIIAQNNKSILTTIIVISLFQLFIISLYYIYLYKSILKPFKDMKEYASRISSGNLDVPLKMDKNNSFGAFTESFDIMREELKKARIKEKEANDSKRELVAKLSHDIKTPVASIKSTSELGYAISKDDKDKAYFDTINKKSDQINTLVSNLLISSLEDLEEIKINPTLMDSYILYELIKNSDYLSKVDKYVIPECKIYADRLRLQQVIDNIISNSYKYAKTDIHVESFIVDNFLVIEFRDYGAGVNPIELPLLTEKFRRGENSKSLDGVGLGLYISKTFLDEMEGSIELKNGNPGFIVIIKLRIN